MDDEKKKKSLSDELFSSDDFFKAPEEDIFSTPAPKTSPKKEAPKKPTTQRKSLIDELGEDFLKSPVDNISLVENLSESLPASIEENLPPPSAPAVKVTTMVQAPTAARSGLVIGIGIAAAIAVVGAGAFYYFVLRPPSSPKATATTSPAPPKPSAPEAPRIPVAQPQQAPPAPTPPPVATAPVETARPALPPPALGTKAEKPKFTLLLGEFRSEGDLANAKRKAEDIGLDTTVSKKTTTSEAYYLTLNPSASPDEANAVYLKLSIMGFESKVSGVTVKVGPFASLMDALAAKGKLNSAGYPSKPDVSSKTETTFRLTGGKFVSKEEAKDTATSLGRNGLSAKIVPIAQ